MIRIKDAKFVYVYNKDRKSLNIENLKVEQHDDNSGFKLFFDTFGMPIDYISGMRYKEALEIIKNFDRRW